MRMRSNVCLLQTSWQPFEQKEHFQSVAKNNLTLKKTFHIIVHPTFFSLVCNACAQVRCVEHVEVSLLKWRLEVRKINFQH